MAETRNDIAGPPSRDEIRVALGQLQNGKAAGIACIPPEAFKAGGEPLVNRHYKDSAELWPVNIEGARGSVPQSWQDAEVVTLFENKGSMGDPGNYRGIFILDIGGKVCASIIHSGINILVEKWIGDYQCGFRKRQGTSHQIHALRRLQSEARRLQSEARIASLPTAVVFVDFTKAFDSPPCEALF